MSTKRQRLDLYHLEPDNRMSRIPAFTAPQKLWSKVRSLLGGKPAAHYQISLLSPSRIVLLLVQALLLPRYDTGALRHRWTAENLAGGGGNAADSIIIFLLLTEFAGSIPPLKTLNDAAARASWLGVELNFLRQLEFGLRQLIRGNIAAYNSAARLLGLHLFPPVCQEVKLPKLSLPPSDEVLRSWLIFAKLVVAANN